MNYVRKIIHCIAQCKDCEWTEDAYKIAAWQALKHSNLHGHAVTVEQGVVYTIGPGKQ